MPMPDPKAKDPNDRKQMKDQDKGGEDRVKNLKEEQQREIDKEAPDAPDKYPDAPGNPEENDVPPGT
ncbi:MAG: hypothetical protein ACLFRG_14345 [Desulfococcaceae bacterium]